MTNIEWVIHLDDPVEPGWYAIRYGWCDYEGFFIGAWFAGEEWDSGHIMYRSSQSFQNKQEAKEWGDKNDPEFPYDD